MQVKDLHYQNSDDQSVLISLISRLSLLNPDCASASRESLQILKAPNALTGLKLFETIVLASLYQKKKFLEH